MPVVPAYSRPTVTTAALPNVQQSSVASPEILGGGANNIIQVGQGLQKTGADFSKIANAIQERDNADRVMRAETALKSAATAFHTDIENRRGQNAWGVTQDANKWWDDAPKKYGAELINDVQRLAFEQVATKQRANSVAWASGYEAKQRRKSLLDSATASIASSINAAAAAPDDQATIDLNRQRIASTLKTIGHLEGWSKPGRQGKLADNMTMLHKKVIEAKLEHDPQAADQYYQANKDEIKGADRAVIERKIRQASALGDAQKAADKITATGGTASEQLQAAREIKDPDTRNKAVLLVKQRQAESKSYLETDQKNALDDTWRIVVNSGDINAIPQHTWSRLSGEGQKQVMGYLTARADKTLKGRQTDDFAKLDQVEKAIELGDITDPKQLQHYEPFLKDSTLKTLRTKIEKRGEIKPTLVQRAFEDRLGTSRARWGDGDRNQWLTFQKYILDNVRDTKRPEDLDLWADRWFMKGYGTQDTFLRNDPNTYGEAAIAGRKDFVLDTPDAAKGPVKEAMDLLAKKGVPVPKSSAAGDEFYTTYYQDAHRYLTVHSTDPTPARIAAYAYLRGAGKPITVNNIDYVAGQL